MFRNVSWPQSEKIKKNFQRIFRENDLEIVISCNMKRVNSLDVTLNLNDRTYRPYHKPNDEIMYIHWVQPSTNDNQATSDRYWITFAQYLFVERDLRLKCTKMHLKSVDKHFSKHHKFRKIFNRNTVKISFSCLPNMKSKISKHNRKILATTQQEPTQSVKTCSCPRNTICPMAGKCLEKDILYIARIASDLPNYNTKEYTLYQKINEPGN